MLRPSFVCVLLSLKVREHESEQNGENQQANGNAENPMHPKNEGKYGGGGYTCYHACPGGR